MGKSEAYLEKIWDFFGGTPTPRNFPLMTSVCYYSLTLLIGRLLRMLARRFTPKRFQSHVLDFITTFQVMACSLENAHIRTHYGYTGYICVSFIIGLWVSLTVRDSTANPATYIVKYTRGLAGLWKTCISIAVQLCGGLISYRYAKLFWWMELTDFHTYRYHSLHCNTDLRVLTPVGFGVEFVGTVLDWFLALSALTPFVNAEKIVRCLLGGILSTMGLSLTGMYLNPINATNQTFGCRGVSLLEFFLVYWVAPFSGAAFACTLQRHLQDSWKTSAITASTETNGLPVNGTKLHRSGGKRAANKRGQYKRSNSHTFHAKTKRHRNLVKRKSVP